MNNGVWPLLPKYGVVKLFSSAKFYVCILGFKRKRKWWTWYSVESIWWEQRRWPNWIVTPSQWHSSRNGISFWQTTKIILHVLWQRDLHMILWTIIRILVCQPNLYPFIYIMMLSLRFNVKNCQTVLMIYTDCTEVCTMACCIIGIFCSLILNRQEPKAMYFMYKDFWGKVHWVHIWL